MNDEHDELDQAALFSCIWKFLPDSYKNNGFTSPPKMNIMMPGNLTDKNEVIPPIEYYEPKSKP